MAEHSWDRHNQEYFRLGRLAGFSESELEVAVLLQRLTGSDAAPYTEQWTLVRIDGTAYKHHDFGGKGGRTLPEEFANLPNT